MAEKEMVDFLIENLKHDNQRMEKALEEIRSFTAYTVGSGTGEESDFSPKLRKIYYMVCKALRKEQIYVYQERENY